MGSASPGFAPAVAYSWYESSQEWQYRPKPCSLLKPVQLQPERETVLMSSHLEASFAVAAAATRSEATVASVTGTR